jgi:predicted DNA-binding transcriptional regulator AlpA
MTIAELAEYFDLTPAAIYRWNHNGSGPKRIQIGKKIFYRRADVIEWIDSRRAK